MRWTTRKTPMADWVPPDGYKLCGTGTCGEPKATGAKKADPITWECQASDKCQADGEHACQCYLMRVHPRSRHVAFLNPDGASTTSPWQHLPPGWKVICLCMYPDPAAKAPPPTALALTPPDGYTISTRCEGECGFPVYNTAKETWTCPASNMNTHADPNCYLVQLPRQGANKDKIEIVGKPGEEVHRSHLNDDDDVFCICLHKQ